MNTEEKLEELGERWGFVVVTLRPEHDDSFRWNVMNHTDEFGAGDEDHRAEGETLEQAIENALNEDYEEW